MKHHALTAAMGILVAAALVPATCAQAASGDPTGIWRKSQQGERPGKFEIFRCGSGKRYLCAKIVWLQDPLDSHGRPLHDVRNENPRMRDRPILGLPIMQGLVPSATNQWKGNIYNPEDGNTYSVTLTLVSHNQINVRGCKGWILCGTRTWLRSSLPKPKPEPEIEASAEPDAKVQPASATAAAEPDKPAPQAKEKEDVFAEAQMATPIPAVEDAAHPGYQFLNTSAASKPVAGLSGESVPSMFVMNTPIGPAATDAADETPATAAPAPKPAVAVPKPNPKPQTIEASAASVPEPHAAPVVPASKGAAVPTEANSQSADGQSADTAEEQTAETAAIDESQLTWRERRRLRRQQKHMMRESRGLLPWLR
jgi:uncharacterized protein (DUF2147 family)